MTTGSVVRYIFLGMVFFAGHAAAQVDSWTNTASTGLWHDATKWSLGIAPTNIHNVFLTNATTKTVTVNAATPAINRTINSLTLRGIGAGINTLQLTNMGAATPFHVLHTLSIGTNAVLVITNSALVADGLSSADFFVDGIVSNRAGGSITVTNSDFIIGNTRPGILVNNGGTIVAGFTTFGNVAGAPGTFTMSAGSFVSSNGIAAASGISSTGAVWITGGDAALFVTGIGESGSAQMTVSNGTTRGTTLTLGHFSGGAGTFTVAGGTNLYTSDLSVGFGPGSTGAVWITGGVLSNQNGIIGDSGDGRIAVSNGTWMGQALNVGLNPGSVGTLTIAGGTNSCTGNLVLGAGAGSTGAVWVTGGVLSNQDGNLGQSGVGQLTVSNGTWTGHSFNVGLNPGSVGTLTIAGGTNRLSGNLVVGFNANVTGAVWVSAGRLAVTNSGVTTIGRAGSGALTISNGVLLTATLNVSSISGPGTVTVAGGTLSTSTRLTIGDFGCVTTGLVLVSGGSLLVTNNSTNAVLEIRSGRLQVSSGTLRIDQLVITNACGKFIHTGGTLAITSTNLAPALDADGDGLNNGFEQANGLDPFNPADAGSAALRITSVIRTNNDIRIAWTTGIGQTNALERTAGAVDGSYTTNNFAAIFTVTNAASTTTNYVDTGAATNFPSRYYRIRLVP